MNPFTRTKPESFTPWTEAGRARDLGYCPIPVELDAAQRGLEHPGGGGWGFGLPDPVSSHPHVVGILAGRLPYGNSTLEECQSTWLAVLRLEGFNSKKAQRNALDVLAPIVGDAPVRENMTNLDLLIPLRIEVFDCRVFGLRSRTWSVPGEASIYSGGVSFLTAGPKWTWRDRGSLLDVPRASLPALTRDAASDALRELDRVA